MSGEMMIPQGYKQTEVGVIPEDWGVDQLQVLAEKIMVGIASATTHAYRDKGVVMFRNQNIKSGFLDDSDILHISADYEVSFKNKRLKSGDLLTARTGYPGTTCLIPPQYEGAQSFTTLITRPNRQRVEPRYLCCFINSTAGQNYFEQNQIGGGQKNVNAGSLKLLPIPLPPTRAEQEAIAEALSDADALIESLEHLIAKKRQIKQGAMQDLLTGARRLPGFTEEWTEATLGELFNFSGGFSASRDQLSEVGYCYLHYGDIHKSSKSYVDVQAEYQDIPRLDAPLKRISTTSLLEDGDVVFVDASEDDEGTSKYLVVLNKGREIYISGLHTIVAKSKAENIDHVYRRYCFQTSAIKRQFHFFAVGTKVSGISKTNIAKVVLPLPPLHEQTAIATIISDLDTDIAALETKLTKARQLKQGMMQELLTGRIRLVGKGARADAEDATART